MAEPGSLLRRRRDLREGMSGLRVQARWQIGLGLLWLVLAAVSWADSGSSGWVRWGWPVVAVAYLGIGVTAWRRSRRDRARLAGLVGVDLRPVGEATLSRLVAAALDGATADEVTPRLTPGERWTPERTEWLRAFHRDRRQGLDGPAAEVTWAVVEVVGEGRDAERVVGSVRLRRTGEPGAHEIGIWLVRDARGRGVGRSAVRLLLDRAREAGASIVRAETTRGNAGAVTVLRALGFTATVDGERVRAELRLHA